MPDAVHVEGIEADLLWHLVPLAPAGRDTYTDGHYGRSKDEDTMDGNELRALQAPLKERYREQPETALIPARAEAMLDRGSLACRVRSWGGETTPVCIRPRAATEAWPARRTCCWRRWSPAPA